MKKLITLFAIALLLLPLSASATFYVVPNGAGAMNGSAWTDAYADIQTAINAASVEFTNTAIPQEIWVKAGTYSTSAAPILMKEGVSIYGGFSGTETEKNQRIKGQNPWDYSNVSTLNGGGAKRVIEVAANFTNIAIIDGFTITNGNGQGTQLTNSGGGVVLRHNLKLQNSIVTANTTSGNGGGINSVGGIIENCWVYNNTTTSGTIPAAGGIYAAPATGFNSAIQGCLIEQNAQGGVRIQSAGTTTMDRCIIRNNSSTGAGAAIYTNNPGACTITNCLITNNSGNNSIYLNKGRLINSTVSNNVGVIYLASATNIAEVYNNIIVNNTDKTTGNPVSISVITNYPVDKVKNNAVYPEIDAMSWGGSTNTLLITDVPTAMNMVAFESPTTFVGTTTEASKLTEIGNAKWNTTHTAATLGFGDNALIPAGIVTDLSGEARISSTKVDAGAYELAYYNLTVTFNEGGTVNALTSGAVLNEPKGKAIAFTITPASGKSVKSVLYNNAEVKTELVEGVYTTPALTANSTLVVEFEDNPSTGINTEKQSFICFSNGNSIEVQGLSAGETVELYNVTGARVAVSNATNSNVTFNTGKGIYFVKVSDKVQKVVVR